LSGIIAIIGADADFPIIGAAWFLHSVMPGSVAVAFEAEQVGTTV
jgi:hypothetical protein